MLTVPTSGEAKQEALAALRLVKHDATRDCDKRSDDAPLGWAGLLKRVLGVDGAPSVASAVFHPRQP